MNEARFTREVFAPYIAKKYLGPSFAFEAKVVKTGKTLAFSKIKSHQERALRMVAGRRGLYHKISDESRVQKPFDGVYLKGELAYVVIGFLEYKQFGIVDIKALIALQKKNPKLRSISREQCIEIGWLYDMKTYERVLY